MNTEDALFPHEMPITEARLAATKPSQLDLGTAARVVWWLAAHARLFPGEYGEEMGISQAPVDVLVAAANACGVNVDHLICTSAEQTARDAYNARVAQKERERQSSRKRNHTARAGVSTSAEEGKGR